MKLKLILTYCCLSISFIACKDNSNKTSSDTKVSVDLGDVIASHMDKSIHPGDDFFKYANGGWIKKNPIPASESGWGIFNLVEDENLAQLKKISEDASLDAGKPGSALQQIGDFYYAGMDSISIEKQGYEPLAQYLGKINLINTPEELILNIAELQQIGISVAYEISVGSDMKNSERNRVYISQGALGLPDRDYYFKQDSSTQSIRNEYVKHVETMLNMIYLDAPKSKKMSTDILKLETDLASAHKQLAELRDPYANYNAKPISLMEKENPQLMWTKVLEKITLKADTVIVGQPTFLKKLDGLVKTTNLEIWKAYLTWNLVNNHASYLGSSFDKEDFNFYYKTLNGVKEHRPRWKRVLEAQESALGDAMGQLFVKEYFPEKTKKRYDDLVEQIVISYREHIQKLDWMTDSTKAKAIRKLNAITRKVGYPAKWKDYSNMNISRESFCKNVIESKKWHFNYEAAKLNKPVDRTEWSMTPQTYNAYYNPSNNEIVLPAAIFTSPGYKDENIDDAVIYGYVGASTIGHELTHGFDDEGRQFDEKGNLKNWWTKEDEQKFKAKANKLVEQFNKMTVLNNLQVNGKATLGENIADLGGIVIALDAFKKTKQYQEGKMIEGLTPLQRYFMGYAYGWMQTRTPEKLASQILTDVHAPIFLRVNGPMTNCDEWYRAFQVTPQHKLFRDSISRVRIW
jgi:putative endopeptidase